MADASRAVYRHIMRALLHIILATCLVWCALGIAEPGEASPVADQQHWTMNETPSGHAEPGEVGEPAHHHHCPVAPELPSTCLPDHVAPVSTPRAVLPIAPLDSLALAPPLQPPSAA